jgi:serine/threonine-protein kinase
VYSLGVMLYELLAGRRPYETAGKTLDAVLDLVLHADPPRPSTSPRGALPYDPGQLRGDLDAIVLKAMSKEPDRRYASAEALAEDLGRHLEKRPVLARPDGRAYVAGRFVRRHRAAVAALAVAVVAVLGGLGVALWQARVARAERDRATVQMRTAQQTTKLLSGIFENANPVVSRGRTVTARDLLDAGTSAIDRDLAGEPEAQAALLLVMARAYVRQDQTARALELAERALSLRESLPSRWQDLAESLHAVGQIRRRRGQLSEALPPLQRAARLYDAGSDDRLAVECLRDLALTLRGLGRNAEARVPLGRAIALEERAAPESARLGLLLNNLGNLRVAEGDLVAGRAALERSIHVYGKSAEAGTWSSTLPMLSLADLLRQQEEFEPARALFERALAVGDETFGRQSTSSAYTLGRLGELALAQGDLALARELLSESSRLYEATEPGAIGAYVTRGFMGRLLLAERKPAQALPLLQEVVAYRTRSNGPKHADLASALVDLALAQRAHHGPAAAQPTLARALEIQRAAFSSAHPALIRTLNALADMTEAQGDREAALGFADEAVRIASARLPARHSERLKAEARVARLRGR